jgi:hypothetical protein
MISAFQYSTELTGFQEQFFIFGSLVVVGLRDAKLRFNVL